MNLELSLFLVLLVSSIFSFVARKFHSSDVIGLIIAGLFLSLPFVNVLLTGHEAVISKLSIAGLFSLMFLAGFEVAWNIILKEEKDAIAITLATVFCSLAIGTAVMLLLGYSLATALVMGICFGITAEAAKARALIQLKKIDTKIGSLLMGTGITNDVLGMAMFVFVLNIFVGKVSMFESFMLIGVLLSFILGSLVHHFFDRFSRKIKILEKILLFSLVPFFFINMGIEFSHGVQDINYAILFIVVISAALSQILGVFLTKPITKLRPKQLYLLGWGMNAKGAVELAIAHIALSVGILSNSLYASIVVMVIVTSIAFQIVMFRMVRKDPGIMDG